MADGARPLVPKVRLCAPLVGDYLRLAHRMRPDEVAQYLAVTGLSTYDPDQAARAFIGLSGVAHAMIDCDNNAILIGGHEEVRTGVWQGWMLGTMEGWGEYGFAISRCARRMQDALMGSGRCHRVQIYAAMDRPAAHEWYERALGMRREGVHKRFFADGSDAVCYAIARN